MSPLKSKRPTGRHETGPQTIPDATPEEPMTVPQTAPDDVMDDWLDAFERAQQRVELAKASIPGMEKTIQEGQERADRIRAEAQRLRTAAAAMESDATELLTAVEVIQGKLGKARDNIARHTNTANAHGANLAAEIGNGAEDPRARRERLAKAAKEAGEPNPHPDAPEAPFPPSPLDGPHVPIGPTVTHPWRAQTDDLEKAQPVPAVDGGPS